MTDAVDVALPTADQIDAVYRDVWSTVPHDKRLTVFAQKIAIQAVMAERKIWQVLEENQCSVVPNYIRDGSGRFNGWIVAGRGMRFEQAPTPYEAAQKFAAAIRAQPEPKA